VNIVEETGFFKSVYDIVQRIPEGKVISYGQIARALGRPRGARIVGYAMRQIPKGLDIHGHRVVKKDGSLAPGRAFGLEGLQRTMLENEGVGFDKNGNVDMKKYEWIL
jgi:methylated-DNA-protein-cysteine methyltransferase-like protein